MSACGTGIRQSSAASDDDTGHIHPVQSAEDKPTVYTTQAGDSLIEVAARPEIFGDPELWPLLKDANAESIGSAAADTGLKADLALEIPRNTSPEAIEAARVRARHFEAEQKNEAAEKMAAISTPVAEPTQEDIPEVSPAPVQALPQATALATDVATVQPTPVPAAPEPPASGRQSKMLPLFVLLALVLAALGAVFYVFFRRDKQDFE